MTALAPERIIRGGWTLSRLTVLGGAILMFAAVAALADGRRDALLQVVRACVVNHALTGASFPCLRVDTSKGVDSGYILLRAPFGRPDTILSPTREVLGVEDPSLRSPTAPNYFADAWNARDVLTDLAHRQLPREEVGLAINSRYTRTQDQFHIHLGCIASNSKRILAAIAPKLTPSRWVSSDERFYGFEIWGREIVGDTLEGVNPIKLADEGLPVQADGPAMTTIVVTGLRLPDGRDGFAELAWRSNPANWRRQFTAEDFLDERCSQ